MSNPLPQVLGLLEEMHREGVQPDEVTTASLQLYTGTYHVCWSTGGKAWKDTSGSTTRVKSNITEAAWVGMYQHQPRMKQESRPHTAQFLCWHTACCPLEVPPLPWYGMPESLADTPRVRLVFYLAR